MNVETLTIKNEEYAVVPMSDYTAMLSSIEDMENTQAMTTALDTEEEYFPAEFVEQLLLSETNNIKLWREYRGMSAAELAKHTGINPASISKIEHNKREPTIAQVKVLARVLGVDVDDLV